MTRRKWHWQALAIGTPTLTVLLLGIILAGANHGPFLELRESHHDFGNVLPGSHLAHEFQLFNKGNEDLIIKNLKTSCGCAPAALVTDTIRPGKASSLSVRLDVPSRNETASHSVTFTTNDPLHPVVHLTFRAEAHWPILVDPPAIHVPMMLHGNQTTREIELASFDGKPFVIDSMSVSRPYIQIASSPNSAAHRQRIRINILGEQVTESFQGSIEFRLGFEPGEKINVIVPVTGSVVSVNYGVSPTRLSLGIQTPGAEVKRLLVHSETLPNLRSIEATSDDWKLIDWQSEGRTISVTVCVPHLEGYSTTNLLLHWVTDEEPFVLPVSCLVAR